jgi:hypothetical protein
MLRLPVAPVVAAGNGITRPFTELDWLLENNEELAGVKLHVTE